jgi:hypothetical protein
LGMEPGRVEEKIREGKTQRDPAIPGQKPSCNPLIFIFLLKRYYFIFFFKLTWLKLRIWILNRVGSENYVGTIFITQSFQLFGPGCLYAFSLFKLNFCKHSDLNFRP